MSDNQNLGSVPDAVADIETAITDVLRDIDAAMSDDLTVVTTAGGTITLTEAQVTRAAVVKLTGTPAAAYTVDVPATHALPATLKKYIGFINTSGQTATVQIVGGAGLSVDVVNGDNVILYTDGVDFFEMLSAGEQSLETKVNRITTDQTITGSPEQVQWNNEIRDQFAGHDNVTNNQRVVIDINTVDAQVKLGLLNVLADAVTTARIVRYNISDVLQEVVAEAEAEENQKINLLAINVRGAAIGDYLVVDLDSTDASVDVDRTASFFLVRRSTGGSVGAAGAPAPFTAGSSFCMLSGKVESFTHNVNKVTVWTEDEDTDAYFGGGTVADEQVVLPFTGRYRITYKIVLASAGATSFIWQVVLRLNRGATTTFDNDFPKLRTDGRYTSAVTAIQRVIESSGIIDATAADEIDLLMFHFGVTRNTIAEGYFLIEYLGPTPV
jgi:hypothetical protein